ncbi:Mitogen-activated protein kinase 11 [Cichlidogyrus casuarinus]|uniref:Mitogen-activated protein kinase 11 n=1 Tax=Cichlidogyrus casuarinus TaxID=1844966 RepID=A0ABD2QDS5_9PLAT
MSHKLMLKAINGEIETDYLADQIIEGGSYGVVCSATQIKSGERVAAKMLLNPVDHSTNLKFTYREILYLSKTRHNNLIQLVDIMTSNKSAQQLKNIVLIFPLMDLTLTNAITSYFPSLCQANKRIIVRMYTYQILCGLNYLHKCGIFHRDLKPANIGVKKDEHNRPFDIYIMDFGMARNIDDNSLTSNVTTPLYMAPEMVLNRRYDEKVDIWSLGCILVEMITSKPLIEPEGNEEKVYEAIPNAIKRLFGDHDPNQYSIQLRNYFMQQVLAPANREWMDEIELVVNCMIVWPQQRLSAQQALDYGIFAELRDPETEQGLEVSFDEVSCSANRTNTQWKEDIWLLIRQFKQSHPL